MIKMKPGKKLEVNFLEAKPTFFCILGMSEDFGKLQIGINAQ